MQAEDGQFLEIEPGIGKLVSLMSLQMLPRRIALDFRDVFSKGFKFDRIDAQQRDRARRDGDQGVPACTGSAADVEHDGQVDLALETQNLTVQRDPAAGRLPPRRWSAWSTRSPASPR